MKLLIFQHGNYAEAYRRFARGGDETYRDQKRSVDFVARLAEDHDVTTVCIANEPHRERLAPDLRSVGIPDAEAYAGDGVPRLFDEFAPDLLVCRTPHRLALGWAQARNCPTLPCFADIFATSGLRTWWRNRSLGRVLREGPFPCVANHSLSASRSMQPALGLSPERIVPWDWSRVAADPTAKTAPQNDPPRLFYAGALTTAKGLGDCLEAVALLHRQGVRLRFEVAGGGDVAAFADRAAALGIGDFVSFLGLIPNAAVRAGMRRADLVVVPSRHEYPEGLPNTLYEGLASRTPMVISDHPAFAGRFATRRDCLVFDAASPESLAARLRELVEDDTLYSRLSQASAAALENLYVGLEWTELMRLFIDDPRNRSGWVRRNSLAAIEQESGRSDEQER